LLLGLVATATSLFLLWANTTISILNYYCHTHTHTHTLVIVTYCNCIGNFLRPYYLFVQTFIFVNFNCNYAYICQTSNSPNCQMTTSKQYCLNFALPSCLPLIKCARLMKIITSHCIQPKDIMYNKGDVHVDAGCLGDPLYQQGYWGQFCY
jgi:hypothetical protein